MAFDTLAKCINPQFLNIQSFSRNGSHSDWRNKVSSKYMLVMTTIISLLLFNSCLSITQVSATHTRVLEESMQMDTFNSEEDLVVSFSKYIVNLSDKFQNKRGAFTIALTGDTMIKPLKKLLEQPYINQINWSRWYVFWADERVVKKDDPRSNYKITNEEFLSKVPIPKDHIISITDKVTAESAAKEYEDDMRKLVQSKVIDISNTTGFPKIDVILLGIGHNGHVASLMPNRPQLKENKRWITYIKDSQKPPPERITMTFPVINSSPNVAFVVMGQDMARTVSDVFYGNVTSNELPAKMVSPIDGELKWFLDKGAASMLNG